MILARDICASSGNILLGSDTPLTPALGRRLRNWGITFVYVHGEEENTTEPKEQTVAPEEVGRHLQEKFSEVMDDPIMQKIFTAVFRYRIQKDT